MSGKNRIRPSPSPKPPTTGYSSVPTAMPPSNKLHRYGPGPESEQSHGQSTYYPSAPPSQEEHAALMNTRPGTTHGVATGSIGAAYGPYSYAPSTATGWRSNRFSNTSNASVFSEKDGAQTPAGYQQYQQQQYQQQTYRPPPPPAAPPRTNTMGFLWDAKDPDLDDALHNPDPVRDAILDRKWTFVSWRGLFNIGMLVVLLGLLIFLFAAYPIYLWYSRLHPSGPGYNLGGINGTGQIPKLNVPTLIDKDTPASAYYRTGFDNQQYNLVFSDEFNTDGRSFYEGDDPFWEAVDLHYWLTGDLEWYSQDAVSTEGGNLVLTLTETPTHGLNFKSGMLQSWNKFCFTTGYIEVNVSLPGSANVPGLWPAAWTMGNLARVGYGASTDGLWPFSYDACDAGTFPNQTKNGQPAINQGLSYQPGQRVSACTCPGGDHPGPNVNVGRGAPEIDIMEVEVNITKWYGEASQSVQMAPFDPGYQYNVDGTTLYNTTQSYLNPYRGGPYQEAISALSDLGTTAYNGTAYQTYGFEWWSDPSNRPGGYITWQVGGKPTWTMNAATLQGNQQSQLSQRLIPEEPVSIAFNLGLSTTFQLQDWKHLQFPSKMYIDYVRVYQRQGYNNIGCDPPNYPTADYINRHPEVYANPNLTTWEQAGYTRPKNRLFDGC